MHFSPLPRYVAARFLALLANMFRIVRRLSELQRPPCAHCTGSDDEAAGLQERAERILYFFPRDVGLQSQLKHIRFCEGLIDFAR